MRSRCSNFSSLRDFTALADLLHAAAAPPVSTIPLFTSRPVVTALRTAESPRTIQTKRLPSPACCTARTGTTISSAAPAGETVTRHTIPGSNSPPAFGSVARTS